MTTKLLDLDVFDTASIETPEAVYKHIRNLGAIVTPAASRSCVRSRESPTTA